MIDWQETEDELIRFAYKKIWNEAWRGNEIPTHIFKSFLANTADISASFTDARRSLKSNYLDNKEGRFAYLLYFHLANVQRNLAVFENMRRHGLLTVDSKRVLDYGSGLGCAMWAYALAMQSAGLMHTVDFTAMDRSKKGLADAEELFKLFVVSKNLPKHNLSIKISDAFDPRTSKQMESIPAPFDTIICSNMINELIQLSIPKTLLFLKLLVGKLSPHGQLVIVEPALNQTSRNLTLLRDKLIEKESCYTPLPCGHQGGCPLNKEPRDWCHFQVDWTPPNLRKRFEKGLDHQSGNLKYSYLVVKKSKDLVPQKYYRVISDKLYERDGHTAWLLCSDTAKLKLLIPNPEVKAPPYKFLKRGDLVFGEFEKVLDRRKDLQTYGIDVKLKSGTLLSKLEQKP